MAPVRTMTTHHATEQEARARQVRLIGDLLAGGYVEVPVPDPAVPPERFALKEAIRENPEDDAACLVYSDWLEDHGEGDRAAFVRVQLALARLPDGDPERSTSKQQEECLLAVHRLDWLGVLLQVAPARYWVFHRGLPTELAWRGGPLDTNEVVVLASSSHLARVTALSLCDRWIGAAGAAALAASPHLARLTSLTLTNNRIGDAGATALAESPSLARLTSLTLRSNEISDAGAGALARSPHLARLTTLDLRGNVLSAVAATTLARSPHLAQRTSLALGPAPAE